MSLLQDYLDSLPEGTKSFPGCRVKSDAFDLISNATEEAAPEAFRELRDDWIPHGPTPSGWIPEAYANSLTLLFRDRVHGSDDARCRAAFKSNNRVLFQKPVYRVVMLVLSPTLAIMGAEKRWGTFRQGSRLRAEGLVA